MHVAADAYTPGDVSLLAVVWDLAARNGGMSDIHFIWAHMVPVYGRGYTKGRSEGRQ